MNTDMTYCINGNCPFKDCERHHTKMNSLPDKTVLSIANFAGTCNKFLQLKKNK